MKKFRDNYKSVDLVRVDGPEDGGHLVPDILETVDFCFCAGIRPSVSFEMDLSKSYGVKSFLADASIDMLPMIYENLEWDRKFIGGANNPNTILLSDCELAPVSTGHLGIAMEAWWK